MRNPKSKSTCSQRLNQALIQTLVVTSLLGSIGNVVARPRPPLPPLPEFTGPALFHESFDQVYTPRMAEAELLVPSLGKLHESWSGYALQRSGKVTPFVVPALDAGGCTNVAGGSGAVRLWVAPYWTSSSLNGAGPGHNARICELMIADEKESALIWSLQVAPDGSTLQLIAETDGGYVTLLTAAIAWTAQSPHCLTLNYGPNGTALFVDGEWVALGQGTFAVPPPAAALVVGSTVEGSDAFEGEVDEVFTFARVQTKAGVVFYYTALKGQAALGAVTEAEWLAQRAAAAQRQAERAAAKLAGGMQMMLLVGGTSECVTNVPVYLTNIVSVFDTNQGWTVTFDIQGGTNGLLYDVFTTTNLVGNNITNSLWTWLERGPTCNAYQYTNQPEAYAFYVLGTPQDGDGDGLTDAFERLVSKSDPQDSDTDDDGLPDGWEWKHFGQFDQSAGGDYDQDGYTNLQEYQAGSDPNNITFALTLTNAYAKTAVVPVSVVVSAGVPDSIAVLVDSTNLSTATWTAFASNINVSLGTVEGWHDVRIGLRGHSPDSAQSWRWRRLKLDYTPPALVITNPSAGTVASPMIQVLGYAPEPLASLRYDLTNAEVQVTNVMGLVSSQHYDTNTLEFTTNWFQCYDLALANGQNTITLRAVDLAGNTTVTNISVVLDFSNDTNAPALDLSWPQDGGIVGNTNFTCRGRLDDASATVVAEVVDATGATNSIPGWTARDGHFWIPDLPLADGTNLVTLITMDAAGNMSMTNFSVVRSDVRLTINDLSGMDLNQPTITVSGTINSSDYAVWVNGVRANVNGGTWIASQVPLNEGGTALIEARAIPLSDNGGSGNGQTNPPTLDNPGNPGSALAVDVTANWDRNGRVFAATYSRCQDWLNVADEGWTMEELENYDKATASLHFYDGQGAYEHSWMFWDIDPPTEGTSVTLYAPAWWPNSAPGTNIMTGGPVGEPPRYRWTSTFSGPNFYLEQWDAQYQVKYDGYTENGCRTATTEMKLDAGGGGGVVQEALFVITASAQAYATDGSGSATVVPPQQIEIGALGSLGPDGRLYVMMYDGAKVDVTPRVAGVNNYTFNVSATKHRLKITANGQDLDAKMPEFCAGQKVDLSSSLSPELSAPPPINYFWLCGSDYVNKIIPGSANASPTYIIDPSLKTNSTNSLWWCDGGQKVVISQWTFQPTGGPPVTVSKLGHIIVHRPTLTAFTNFAPRSFMWLTSYTPDNLGYGDVSLGTNGMVWEAKIQSKYNGRFGVTQKFRARYHQYPMAWDMLNTLNSEAVDAGEWYSGYTKLYNTAVPGSHLVQHDDYPRCPSGSGGVEVLISLAEDYVRFKPGLSENDRNIYITLGIVRWQAHGNYSRTSGWITNNTPAASPPDNSHAFPVWFEVIPDEE